MWTLTTLHPMNTFRTPTSLGPLQAHITNFVAMGAKGLPSAPQIELDPPAERLAWLVEQCKAAGVPLAVDVETRPPDEGPKSLALLPGFAQLRAFGVGAEIGSTTYGMSWFYPCSQDVWNAFVKALADTSTSSVWCNGHAYDLPVLQRYGAAAAGPIEDIRDGRRVLVSTARVGLGPQAGIYLQAPPWKAEAVEDEDDEKGYVDAAHIPREKLLKYNALDGAYTAQIRTHHVREFGSSGADRGRLERLYQQQLRLARAAASMHVKGFPVDEVERKRLSAELAGLAQERAADLKKLLRPHEVTAGSFRISPRGGANDNDLRALLFRECARPGIRSFGFEVPFSKHSRTDSGMASVDKSALLQLWAQDNLPDEAKAIIRAVWKCNAPLKARSTFIESKYVLEGIGPDGRMHPRHNSCGTETGRWSCSKPNLYNLSEKQDAAESTRGDIPNVRSMYVAPPGHVIVHRDFAQLELEVMADFTGDAVLRRMLATGDAHTARVHEWFGIPLGAPVPKMVRRQGKVVGFSSQYGAGIETVYLKVLEQIPEAKWDEIAALHGAFPEKHVGIAKHWVDSLEFANRFGYQRTAIMDRRINYPPGDKIQKTETSNYPIQGSAADIANGSMVGIDGADAERRIVRRLEREFPGAWLAMHTYDSFDVICLERDAAGVDQLLNECMQGPWDVGAGARLFKSDCKIGHRWSEV